jgi:cytochrome P450
MTLERSGDGGPTSEGVPMTLPAAPMELFDPAPELAALREQGPLCPLGYPDGHVGWLVTGRALARTILGDSRFALQPRRCPVDDGGAVAAFESLPPQGDLLRLDPPEHRRLRRRLAGYFTVRRVEEHRAAIERIVATRLDAMEQAGPPVDLVDEFARAVPSMAICELLGVPHGDSERFKRRNSVLFSGTTTTADEKLAAMRAFYEYACKVIDQKRADPRDDLLSDLIATDELTDEELAGIAAFLFGAGHQTTADTIAASVFFLLYNRDRWETLRSDPSSIDRASEELLRYLGVPIRFVMRTALEDVEEDGAVVRAGDAVTVHLSVASRDPAEVPDPDRFEPSRDAGGHVKFGHGRHMCLGQHLARLELRVSLQCLMQRFPALHLAMPREDVPLSSSALRHGFVERLPVAW